MEWQSHKLNIRLDDLAFQSDSSVYLEYGKTVVLATVVLEENPPKDYINFAPLSVHYIEKTYAARRIPGGYLKREGKPQDHETLISRVIDRGLRPLIAKGLQNEVQVIIHVLSYDPEIGTVVPSFLAASIALQRSPVPFKGPVAACHVGLLNNQIIINPTSEQLSSIKTDFLIAGNEKKILMMEGGASEASNTEIMRMVRAGIKAYQPIIKLIKTFKPKPSHKKPLIVKPDFKAKNNLLKNKNTLQAALQIPVKKDRRCAIHKLEEKFIQKHSNLKTSVLKRTFEDTIQEVAFDYMIATKRRIDKRKFEDIRPIEIETNLLPSTHASTLFTRGETQVLGVLTLGRFDDKQMVDTLSGLQFHQFLSHYNFPKFSVGEIDKMSAPSRREIGHGQIVHRAISPLLPDPLYTYRFVSEVLSSNGSSSMASVCAGSLCFMEAGVELKRHVAGVALGLVKHQEHSGILVDISGDEDYIGHMDFKLCATEKGITALQVDTTLQEGLSLTTLNNAIQVGHKATLKIITKMNKKRHHPAKHLPDDVKRVSDLKIDRKRAKVLLTNKSESGTRSIEKITNTRIDFAGDRFLISAENFNNIFRAKREIYQSLNFFQENHEYIVSIKDIDTQKIEYEGFEGLLENKIIKKHKLSKGHLAKVKFLEISKTGELIFQMICPESTKETTS
ncbi:MAG: polyribonucleotide nucleotidyltransferase [Alphaproteobacteria bacterium]|nr:MAG: polyribonucleotide nucleotidyltransferase [Alphaproteobacteria bacterium]